MTNTPNPGAHDHEIALVTGANKGLGREIARQLADAGMTVYLGARNTERGRAAEVELGGSGGDVRFVQLDVTRPEQIRAAAEKVHREHGRLDVLVNNAGIALPGERGRVDPDELSVDQLRSVFEVNVFGLFAVTQAFLPLLRRSGRGRVVNMSTPLGSTTLMADPASGVFTMVLPAYSSSKAAANALTVFYAKALESDGVRVNAANPSQVGTDLNGLSPEADGVRSVQRGAVVPVRLATDGSSTTGRFVGDDDFAVDGFLPW